MAIIELDEVWLSYRPRGERGEREAPRWALRDISLSVAAGECVGVLGANGSGKSTLLRVIAGIFTPTRGSARLAPSIGCVLDLTLGLNRDLSGSQALEVYASIDGITGSRWRELRPFVIEATQLSELTLSHALSTYSLGMLLRLQFALAVAQRPVALVVDEVLAAADSGYRSWATGQIKALRDQGTAVILASHDASLIRALAQRVIVLERGAQVFEGPTRAALQHYRSQERVRRAQAPTAGR